MRFLWEMWLNKSSLQFKNKKCRENLTDLTKIIETSGSKTATLFSRDVDHETITQNIRETDPTTIEFHRLFRKLLNKVQEDNKRVIFVLDNIDRLAIENVPLVWSEVRSLFSNELLDGEIKNAHVTAIVPYDKDYILKSFKPENNNPDKPEEEGDLFDKTFIQVLQVSPPIGNDWKQFLNKRIKKVFIDKIDENTSFRLFRLLEYYFQSNSIHPTPRRIIKFVNDIASLWSQWEDLIAIDSLALYVLHKPQIENDPKALKEANLVSDRYLHIAHAKDWQRDFAALVFNVEPKIADQVFLGGEVSRLLTSDNIGELKDAFKLDSFPQVLSNVLAERAKEWATDSYYTIDIVATNLNKLKLSGQIELDAWRELNRALPHISDMDITELYEDFGEKATENGLLTIVRRQERNTMMEAAQSVATIITNSSKPNDGKTFSDGEAFKIGQVWLKAIFAVVNVVDEVLGKGDELLQNVNLLSDVEFHLGVAFSCSENDRISFAYLKPKAQKTDILSNLNSYIDSSPTKFYKIINELKNNYLDKPSQRAQFLEPIATKLRSSASLEDEDRQALLKAFALMYEDSEAIEAAKDELTKLVTDGTLLWHGQQAEANEDYESSAICIWLIIQHTNDTSVPAFPAPHPQLGDLNAANIWYTSKMSDAEIQDDEVTLFANYAANNHFPKWVDFALNDPTANELFKKVLIVLIEEGEYSRLQVADMAKKYVEFKQVIGEELALKFLTKYADWNNNFEKSFDKKTCLSIPDEFIEDVSKLDQNVKTHEILEILDKVLKNLTQAEWKEALEKEDNALRLLVVRQKTSNLTIPSKLFKPALLGYALAVLSEKFLPKKYSDQWINILKALPNGTRSKLPAEILRKINDISVTPQGAENLLKFFGEVADKIPLNNNADVALNQFLLPLIESSQSLSKEYIRKHKKDIKNCYNSAQTNSQEALEESLVGFDESENNSEKEWAKEVRSIIGIKTKTKIKPNKSDQE